jgi:hypothetical protein
MVRPRNRIDRKAPELALLVPTDQGWRLPRPPAGLPAGLPEPAAALLAGLLRGFCALNGLPLDTLVPLPVAKARCGTLGFLGFFGFLMI